MEVIPLEAPYLVVALLNNATPVDGNYVSEFRVPDRGKPSTIKVQGSLERKFMSK